MSVTVTGPYYVESPRYSGEHHAVTLRKQTTTGVLSVTKGFTSLEAAEAYASEHRV